MIQVAEPVHVALDAAVCYAAIVTESRGEAVRVQFFLPPGAMVPWPGTWHSHSPDHASGSCHRIGECRRVIA